jgi:DNA-binding CsgD family transcriptional regulator
MYMSVPSIVTSLTDRQRLICLLTSVGEQDKRIASLMDLGVRTVEMEKQRVAATLRIPTKHLVIWAVENRHALRTEVKDWSGVSDSMRELFAPEWSSESVLEYSI